MELNPLLKCHIDMENQIMKLSAWIQTLSFVLEGLDVDGTKASKSEASAISLANRYPMYSEMLFLALSGLQDCKDSLEQLHEKAGKYVTTEGDRA